MIELILNMNSLEDFDTISQKLCKQGNRTQFLKEIRSSDILLSTESMYTLDELNNGSYHDSSIEKMLHMTASEDYPTRLMHRLQYLGHCNPGLKSFVNNLLAKACL